MASIIQDWAAQLGLRHQGVLVSAVRGCDGVPREDASKWLVRCYRGCLLRAHVGDVRKAVSFMVPYDEKRFWRELDQFLISIDHYPNHWILHFAHACQIMGHYYPDDEVRQAWLSVYNRIVAKFHMNVESRESLDARLGASEEDFRRQQNKAFDQPHHGHSEAP